MIDITIVVLEIIDILESISDEGEASVTSKDGHLVTIRVERDKRPILRIVRDDKG